MKAVLLFLLLALPAAAQEVPLILRLQVSPRGQVWIGQRVTVTLIAATPNRFATPPTFPELAPQGRAILLPQGGTIPGTERIGGIAYAALQHSDELFPAEAGTLILPPLRMTARLGDGTEASATVEGLRLETRAPPGAGDLSRLVVSPEFRLTASTDRPPEGLRVGEAITRRLRLEARDTAAMLLPVALWGQPEGLAVYPDPPDLRDQSARGELRATREESAAYVPRRSGPMELPGFSISWFEPGPGRIRLVTVDPIRFEALPAAVVAPAARNLLPLLAVGALVLLAAGAGWVALRRWGMGRTPERQAFAALRSTCRAGEPAAAYAALCRWRNALPCPARGAPPPREVRQLEDRLYGAAPATGPWHGTALLRATRRFRQGLFRRQAAHRVPTLPKLNP